MAVDITIFPSYFSKSLIVVIGCALPCILIGFMVGTLMLPSEIGPGMIIRVALADLLMGSLLELSIRAFQAVERFIYMMGIATGAILLRLFCFCIMLVGGSPVNAATWSKYYLSAAILAVISSLLIVFSKIGLPDFSSLKIRDFGSCLRDGVYYAVIGASTRVNSEIDKACLARLSTLQITGAYSVAYRFTDLIMIPIYALLESSTTKFFRVGTGGVKRAGIYAKKLLIFPSLYAVLGGALLFFCAELIPLLLGSDYEVAVPVLKFLAILPLISMLRFFLGMAVITGGDSRRASLGYLVGALGNVSLNICLIPTLGWLGAASATILAEIIMIVFFWKTIS
jgi:O-antigen/teichoic acid export membrane protein